MRTEFYKKANERGYKFIDTRPVGSENMEQLAKRFEDELKNWKEKNPDGVVIITQGMGPDGHTSGIMPYPEDPEKFDSLFNDPKHWVVAYDAGGKNEYPLRVTTTLSFLKEAVDHSVFYVRGNNKKGVLGRVIKKQGTLAQIPALIVHEMKDAKLFTDISFD